eukprot:1144537-Pelagomonas_calceolata.AAC.2
MPQVRAAREEGALRIRTLEESLSRLSNARASGEAAVEAARAVADAERAKRAEARARADAAHTKVCAPCLVCSRLEELRMWRGSLISCDASFVPVACKSAALVDAQHTRVQELLAFEARTVSQLRARLADADAAMAQLWVYTQFGPAAAPVHPPLPLANPWDATGSDAPPSHSTHATERGPAAAAQPPPAAAGKGGGCGVTSGADAAGGGGSQQSGGCVCAGQRGSCAPAYRMLERRLRSQYEELVRRQQMIAALSACSYVAEMRSANKE